MINPTTTRYHRTKVKGKNKQLHRVIMEGHLGRSLHRNEHVHHKNGVKTDNRISNLEVMTPTEHGRLHNLKHNITSKCVVCGREFTPHKTKRKRQQTCSESCRQICSARKRIKVTREQFNEILSRRAEGEKLVPLAEEFGVTPTTISEWCNHGCLAWK